MDDPMRIQELSSSPGYRQEQALYRRLARLCPTNDHITQWYDQFRWFFVSGVASAIVVQPYPFQNGNPSRFHAKPLFDVISFCVIQRFKTSYIRTDDQYRLVLAAGRKWANQVIQDKKIEVGVLDVDLFFVRSHDGFVRLVATPETLCKWVSVMEHPVWNKFRSVIPARTPLQTRMCRDRWGKFAIRTTGTSRAGEEGAAQFSAGNTLVHEITEGTVEVLDWSPEPTHYGRCVFQVVMGDDGNFQRAPLVYENGDPVQQIAAPVFGLSHGREIHALQQQQVDVPPQQLPLNVPPLGPADQADSITTWLARAMTGLNSSFRALTDRLWGPLQDTQNAICGA